MAVKNNKFIKAVKYILLFGLAALLVYLAFRKVNWADFLLGLRQVRWFWIVLFCVVSVVALMIRTVRWKEMIVPFDDGISSIKVWDAINIGNMVSLVIPGGGEVLRCGYVSSKKFEMDKALGTMFCERLWDFISLLLLFIFLIVFNGGRIGNYLTEKIIGPAMSNTTLWVLLAAAVLLVAAFVVISYKLRDKYKLFGAVARSISRLWIGFGAFSKSRNKALIVISSFALWFMYVLMSYCILKAMPALDGLGLTDAAFFSFVGNIASVVPVPGGIGAYHYLVAAAVGLYGISWETGILFATLNHEIHALVILLIGIVSYIHFVSAGKAAADKPEPSDSSGL